MHNPFPKPRLAPKRYAPRRVRDRVRLHGKSKISLRLTVFRRSKGRCEILHDGERCPNPITWESMHLSHERHGIHKTDTPEACKASCQACHDEFHRGGKPVRRKPGRMMSKTEALKYLRGKLCCCGQLKSRYKPFCEPCDARLSGQSRLDLENLTGKPWLKAVADAEKEILSKGDQV